MREEQPTTQHRRRVPRPRALALVILVLLASLFPRLPRLTQSIWFDEYCRTRLHLNAESLSSRLFADVHNPLYNLFMFGWTSVFGDSEMSIRMPTLLAGYVSAAVFAWWAMRRFEDRRIASLQPLGRRSGCSSALPYPPPRSFVL